MGGPAGESDDTVQDAPEQVQPDNGGWGSQAVSGTEESRGDGEAVPDNGGWGSQ
jgi:hypothetical protein